MLKYLKNVTIDWEKEKICKNYKYINAKIIHI